MGQYTGERDTTINSITGDPTTTTKEQQPEMAETYGYPKRHQRRFREGRKYTPTRRGSTRGLIGRINNSGTLGKTQ